MIYTIGNYLKLKKKDGENMYENKFLITGDCHRDFSRFKFLKYDNPEKINIIILGDAGVNYLGKLDFQIKNVIKNLKYNFYLVRGNHEERPENVPNMKLIYDEKVQGEVYWEEQYPNIKYFQDGGIYSINGRKTLVIGGAYSVDKDFRLSVGYKWFEDEQLSYEERKDINKKAKGQYFNLVLSHTCPVSWEPRELFLKMVDQKKVDKTMEYWLDSLKDNIAYGLWLFGHYHGDMAIRPRVQMMYKDIKDIEEIAAMWDNQTLDENLVFSRDYNVNDNLYYKGDED